MASAKKKNAPDAAPSATNDAPQIVREPITVRGNDLLKLLAATGGVYLTQEEGNDAVDAGFAAVNMADTQGNTALVTITAEGRAQIEGPVKGKTVFDIDDSVPMPDAHKKRGGKRGSKYPFEKLEVGQSFHVPKSKDMPNPVSALASSLTGARRRYETPVKDAEGNQVFETVKVKTYATDAHGKRIKDKDGHFVVSGEKEVSKPKTQQTRDFQVFEAAKDDPKGPGARVFRTK